jgi:hypothetical protein
MPQENKKFADATLLDFTNSLVLAQSWGRERVFISEFFGDRPYVTTEEYVTPYQHHTAQWVMADFFEKLGMKKVVEQNIDRGHSAAAVFENIECDLDKTFRGYKHAVVGYEDGEGRRALVHIDRHTVDEIIYKISTVPEQASLLEDWWRTAREQNLYKGKKITAGCRFLNLKNVAWEDVILPVGTKSLLQGMVNRTIMNREVLLANKLSLKRGILMEGSPGNGKTTAVRVIIKELPAEMTAILAQPSHMRYSSDVRAICQMARDLAPCVLVIEDIDWIAEDREHSGDAGKLIELMNQLDGIEEFSNVITIGTTNSVDTIEKAIKNRPGRFDRVVKIDNPDPDCRRQMLKLFTKYYTMSDDVDFDRIVEFTNKLSGAHMSDLCRTAVEKAIDDGSVDPLTKIAILSKSHFEAAIKEVKNKDYSTWMRAKSGGEKKIRSFASMMDEDFGDD